MTTKGHQSQQLLSTIQIVMKNELENKLSMYEAVSELLKQQQNVIANLPALNNVVIDFNNKLNLLHTAARNQMKTSKGITLDKQKAKNALVEKMVIISKGTIAYLSSTDNNASENLVKLSASSIERERDTLIAERCRLALIEIETQLPNLSDYGIEQVDIDEANDLILQYEALVAAPRNAVVARKNATEAIETIVAQIDALLTKQIDGLLAVVGKDNKEVSNLYSKARKIVNYHGSSTKLMGVVLNARGKGVQNARIEAYLGDDEVEANKIETTTDKFGKFSFEGIEAGSYEVKVYVNDVLQGIEKSDIRRGRITRVRFGMEPPPSLNDIGEAGANAV